MIIILYHYFLMIENIHNKKLLVDSFLILQFLYQQNDYERDLEDEAFEKNCYYDANYDYLYIKI